jgi:hypothetical protein
MTSYYPRAARTRHEAELKGLEKAREAALEVAEEEDAPPKARPEDAQEVALAMPGGMG